MSNRKTIFPVIGYRNGTSGGIEFGDIQVVGQKKKTCHPYVTVFIKEEYLNHSDCPECSNLRVWMKEADLEKFAINILKALNSKALK